MEGLHRMISGSGKRRSQGRNQRLFAGGSVALSIECVDRLGAWVRSLRNLTDGTDALAALADQARDLLGGSGGALVEWSAAAVDRCNVGAAGTWGRFEMDQVVADSAMYPSHLPSGSTFVIRRDHGALRAVPAKDVSENDDALAMVLCHGAERLGILIIAYPQPLQESEPGRSVFALIAECISLWVSNKRLHRRSRDQAERIARLSNDLDRMSRLLSRARTGSDWPHP